MRWLRVLLGAGLAVSFAASSSHAEILIGVPVPLTGGHGLDR